MFTNCWFGQQHPSGALQSGSAGSTYACANTGDLLDVRIGDVLATQPSLGYDEIYYKLGRYTLGKDEINSKFNDWCESNGQIGVVSAKADARLSDPSSFQCKIAVGQETAESISPMKTVVIGPGGKPYLTDGHHTLTSYLEAPDGGANIGIEIIAIPVAAEQLDRLAAWNDGKAEDKGEFGKISQPYSSDKPGKLGYAVEYRVRNGH